MEPLSAEVAWVRTRVGVDQQVRGEGGAALEALVALGALQMDDAVLVICQTQICFYHLECPLLFLHLPSALSRSNPTFRGRPVKG